MSGSGVTEVVDNSRAGPRRRRPLEAALTNSGSPPEGEDHQQASSQAAEASQQTAAAKAVVKLSSSQPESPSISTSTIIASSSSWSSPTSRPPRTRRSVPGFPQRVAAPAQKHDTTTIAAVAAKSSSIDCWPTSGGAASTEPEQPALLQFSEANSEPIAVGQAELPEQVLEKAHSGDVLVGSGVGAADQDQDILLGGDLQAGVPPQGAGEVMATTSSLTR